MRSVAEHLAAVLEMGSKLTPCSVRLTDAFGLILAEEVIARFAVPPFDNSAMDGFAIGTPDLGAVPKILKVTGDIPAGTEHPNALAVGEAARIMTGAPLPDGADAVVPVEHTDVSSGPGELPTQVEVRRPVRRGQHIRRAGEDVAVGDLVLHPGAELSPAAVSAAAAVGYGELLVHPRPLVLVISTGSELTAPGRPIASGQIPDSNSLLLTGLLQQFGADVTALTTSDDPAEFRAALDSTGADLVVTSGGVSAGAFEVVRQVTGADCEFSQVAMQPGKPQGLGNVGGRPLLAFPGNPVSVFVSAWLFARPLIARLAGRPQEAQWRKVSAAASWNKSVGREQYLPVRLSGGAEPAHGLGSASHAIASLHLADGLARVPSQVSGVEVGDPVEVLTTNG